MHICYGSVLSKQLGKLNRVSVLAKAPVFRLDLLSCIEKMPRYCFIESCRETSYKNSKRKLFRFPKSNKTFLCDQHFPAKFFGKKKLKESSYDKIRALLEEKGINVPVKPLAEKIVKNKRKFSRMCVVKHCQMTDTSTKPPLRFKLFPKTDNELYDVWMKKCNLSRAESTRAYKYVCEKHFLNKADVVPNCNLTPLENVKRTYQFSKLNPEVTDKSVTTAQEDKRPGNPEVEALYSFHKLIRKFIPLFCM